MSRRKTERLLNLVICLLATRRPLSGRADPPGRAGLRPRRATRPSSGCSSATRTSCARSASRSRCTRTPGRTSPATGSSARPTSCRRSPWSPTRPPCWAWPPRCGSGPAWPRRPAARCSSCARAGWRPTRRAMLGALELRVDTRDPSFPALWEAVRDRRAVRFDYRAAGSESVLTPHGGAVGRGQPPRPLVRRGSRPRPRRAPGVPAQPDQPGRSARSAGPARSMVPEGGRPASDGRLPRRPAVRSAPPLHPGPRGHLPGAAPGRPGPYGRAPDGWDEAGARLRRPRAAGRVDRQLRRRRRGGRAAGRPRRRDPPPEGSAGCEYGRPAAAGCWRWCPT